jgi:uncharacterized iron-regulated protein
MTFRSPVLLGLATLVACSTLACSAPTASGEANASVDSLTDRSPTEREIPTYEGEGFAGARILRLADGAWLTERDFTEALATADVTVFGEQHQTAPVQALEHWVLAHLLARVPNLGLAMEHFQRDEQPVIDKYLAGEIDQATFEAQAQVWPGYATYWRPLVEEARAQHRPVLGLNVPKEVLGGVYAEFPAWPFDVFNKIPEAAASSAALPPRPLAAWDATYQGWFETAYDYASHGQGMGLSYPDALHYFTDLAQIRDETMAYWVSRGLAERAQHLLVVAGDWHVQTRLALPDRVARLNPSAKLVTVTTVPADGLEALRAFQHAGRSAADYIISYTPPPPAPPQK